MVHTADSAVAMPTRHRTQGKNGNSYWRTDFLGGASTGQVHAAPQAYVIDMTPGEVLAPHFHAVDQFQIFVAGSGALGRTHTDISPVLVHYADRHTGYGPIEASAQGFSYFTLRRQSDSGAVFLHMPGYRDKLQPSRRRHFVAQVRLCTAPVLQEMEQVQCKSLCPPQVPLDDGLAASIYRAGQGVTVQLPDPRDSEGQYLLVLAGAMEHAGHVYGAWSVLFIEPKEPQQSVVAAGQGVELLALQFPQHRP